MNRAIVDVQREPQDSDLLGRVLRRTRRLHLMAAVVLTGLSIGLTTAAILFPGDAVRLPMWGKAMLIVLTATSCYAGGYSAVRFVRMVPLSRAPLLRHLNEEPQRVTRLDRVEAAGWLSFVHVVLNDGTTIPLAVRRDDVPQLLDELRVRVPGAIMQLPGASAATAASLLNVAFSQRGTHRNTPR